MLRELQTNGQKTTDAMYKADVAMKVGMAVVKNRADMTADIPSAATVEGFYFVSKERVPTGLNCARGDMSDYDANFVDIAQNEPVKLIIPEVGERYGTDQYVATGLTKGDALMITDGKFVKATASTVPSRLIYGGTYNDAGHTLAVVEIAGATVTNA